MKAVGNANRDRELMSFVGRQGVVGVGQVMAQMEAGRSVTYRRIAACVDRGLLERIRCWRDEPSVVRATRDGLAYAGLALPVASVSPGLLRHTFACTDVAIRAARRHGDDRVLGEREFVWRERVEGRPIASIPVGGSRGGHQRMHRADLAILAEEGVIAVEVELTAKGPRRLDALIRAWRMAVAMGTISEVHYLCEPGVVHRAVERAVARTEAGGFVSVWKLAAGVDHHG